MESVGIRKLRRQNALTRTKSETSVSSKYEIHPFYERSRSISSHDGAVKASGSNARRASNISKGIANLFSSSNSGRQSKAKKKRDKANKKLLASGYSEEELKEFRQVFSLMDEDGSGSIGLAELASAMFSLGHRPSQHELDNLMEEVDTDGSGEIDFQEFCAAIKTIHNKRVTWDDVIKQCFTVFDRDGDGLITEEEFRYILKHLGQIQSETVVGAIFQEFDVDGNGLIGLEEFSHLVRFYMTEEDVESCQ